MIEQMVDGLAARLKDDPEDRKLAEAGQIL